MSFAPINRANYVRRQAFDIFMSGVTTLAAGIGLVLLALILWTLFQRGSAALGDTRTSWRQRRCGRSGRRPIGRAASAWRRSWAR